MQLHQTRSWLPTPGNILLSLFVLLAVYWAPTIKAKTSGTLAATTVTMPYEGRLTDSSDNPLSSSIKMTFALYSVEAGGTALWTEQQNNVVVTGGYFNVMLGSVMPIPQSLLSTHDDLFLGIAINTDGEVTPRLRLGNVPFAAHALSIADGSVTTDKIADGAVTASKLAASAASGIPAGTIVMWSGAVKDIPEGWALCDGGNGTPNLLDRFILSVESGKDPGETGGSHTVTLTIANLPAHTHTFTTDSGGSHTHSTRIVNDNTFAGGGTKGGVDDTSGMGFETYSGGSHSHNGTTNSSGNGAAFDVRPKYYRLAFIMKL